MAPDGERRRAVLAAARLMVVLGGPAARRPVGATVLGAIEGGARLFELRMKGRPRRETLAAARALASLCRAHGALLLVNDDPGIAREASADGVHVGQADAPPGEARRVVGPERLVGLSVHDEAEAAIARAAALSGDLDYTGVGTVFASGTRPDLRAQGPEGIAALLPRLPALPAFAIGGIDAGNAARVVASGVRGVAVGAAVEGAEDVAAAVRALLAALGP